MRLCLASIIRILAPLIVVLATMTCTRPSESVTVPSSQISPAIASELSAIRVQGIDQFSAGRIAEARATFAAGRRRAERAGSLPHSVRFALADATIDLQLQRYRHAMRKHLALRDIVRKVGDPELESVWLSNMSWIYVMTDAFPEAEVAIKEALSLVSKAKATPHLPQMLLQRALLSVWQDDLDHAWKAVRRAVAIADDHGAVALQANIMDSFGWELLFRGQHEAAEAPLMEAFRLRKMNGIPIPDQSYRNLASLRLAQGDLRSAEVLMERAFEVARSVPDPLPVWSLYYRRALIHRAARRHAQALSDLDRALEHAELMRLSVLPAEATRLSAGAALRDLYEAYLDVAYDLFQETGEAALLARSFEVAEQGRAAGLRQQLGEAEELREGLADEYWEVLRQLSAAENAVFQGNNEEEASLRRLRHRLTEMELEAGLSAESEIAPAAPRISELQAVLADHTALFSFYLGEHRSYRWILTGSRLDFDLLPRKSLIEERLRDFRHAVETDGPDQISTGRKIYQLLFGSIHHNVEWVSHWCFLLDGALFEAPLGAAVVDSGDTGQEYLVERHSIRLLPAAGLLVRKDNAPAWDGPILAVSDPIYNRADPRWSGTNGRMRPDAGLELARLAGSGPEVEACLRLYRGGGGSSVLLDGPDATLDAIQRALDRRPRVLHFATHVVTISEGERAGTIALSMTPRGVFEFLGPTAVAATEVHSELVVMSGCASGAGKILPGEGLLGLTRAWLRAGARNVAATLWPTADQSSGVVQSFYRHLGATGIAPHEALRRAQMEMIRSGGWRGRPSHWASYFLISRQ